MDDKIQMTNAQSPLNNRSQSANVQNDTSTQAQQQTVITTPSPMLPSPVSPAHKEHGPLTGVSEALSVSEPSEMQPEISPEVKEAGIEIATDTEKMQLSVADKLAGMEHAKESVPVPTNPSGILTIPGAPFSTSDAVHILKTTPSDDSKHWLAALLLMVWHKFYLRDMREKQETKHAMLQKTA